MSGEYNSMASRLAVFAEQLSELADLLRAGGTAKLRLAFLGIDHLAETVLFEQAERVLDMARGKYVTIFDKGYHFTKKERRELEMLFHKKVEYAQQPLQRSLSLDSTPILDDTDAAIFLVGHGARNEVHHRNRHHEPLIRPVAHLYWQAAARAWVRSCPSYMHSSELTALSERFALLGVDSVARPNDGGILSYATVAQRVVDAVGHDLDVDVQSTVTALAEDIRWRVEHIEGAVGDLERDGLTRSEIEDGFCATQFWRQHGADAELVELNRRRDELWEAMLAQMDEGVDEDITRGFHDVAERASERYLALDREFVPSVTFEYLDIAMKAAGDVETLDDISRAVTLYADVDSKIQTLEEGCSDFMWGWEREVQRRLDEARGK